MMKGLPLPLALVLVACGTPQEQCISANTRDLRVVDKLIAETEGNLKRGYALEDRTVRHLVFEPCLVPGKVTPDNPTPAPVMSTCRDTREVTVTEPKSIDLDAEARKLKQLQSKRKDLLRAAEAVVAQCKAKFPE